MKRCSRWGGRLRYDGEVMRSAGFSWTLAVYELLKYPTARSFFAAAAAESIRHWQYIRRGLSGGERGRQRLG